jgi:hypothetical protein
MITLPLWLNSSAPLPFMDKFLTGYSLGKGTPQTAFVASTSFSKTNYSEFDALRKKHSDADG